MSGESGGAGQVIALPKGGGALQGIGEKFSADLHTGTGNFTVPIALPPGRNGFQPQLNLVYSTGNANGAFGLGWSLSIPNVTRKTSKGVPRYRDESDSPNDWDTFILSGAEDLVPVPGGPSGAQRYRPRTEGLFAHIDRHHRSGGESHWNVHSKDGLVSVYGTPRPSDAAVAWRDPAAVADPARPSHVFAWKLTTTIDPFGNRIEYQYERDVVQTEGPHAWDQVYLSRIRYVDHGNSDDPQFLVTVSFVYEDRPDPFSEYRSGFEIRTVRRCTKIAVATHEGVEQLARTYHLIYLDRRDSPPGALPHNGISLLSQFIVEGHDGVLSETLPPLEFAYTRFAPDRRDFFPITGPDMPPGSLARPEYELADLVGNGLPDILEMNGTVRYWASLGDGRYGLPREMRSAPAGVQLADKGVQLLDADGDGALDLMVVTDALSGYYPLEFGGSWDAASFRSYRAAPSFDLEDPEVRLVDLDGDGVTDAIRSSTRLDCFFNDPHQGWHDTRRVERRAIEEFPDVSFSDERVKFADMAGDGLQDIVLVHDGNVEYWPSLGRGDWAKRISMRNSPRFPYGYDPRRILVGDVDGDGVADLIYVDDTKVTLWINQSGNRWSDPIEIQGTPPLSDMDAVRLADMRGSGVSGVLWSMEAGGLSRATMFFLDFTGGIKPYLLNEMNDHMGAISRVEYAPSTRFYLEDHQQPETRWKTPLPFPVQVVARVAVIDAISGGKLTTEYRYHHGYWDGAEREFRGFGRVDQRDTELFEDYHSAGPHPPDMPFQEVAVHAFSPPTETRTWFHQGPVGHELGDWTELDHSGEFWAGDPQVLQRPEAMVDVLNTLPRRVKRDALRTLRGRTLRTELYALDGTAREDRPYTVTEHLSGVREEAAPDPGDQERLHLFFAHALGSRTTQWERGDDPMSQFAFTGNYDEFGQARSQISIAVPRARHYLLPAPPGDPYLATATGTTYASRDDDDRYIVDRVARVTSHEIVNDGSAPLFALKDAIEQQQTTASLIGQTVTFYDGEAFKGLAFGVLGDHGAPMRSESLVLTKEILHEAYKSGDQVLSPPEEPPYLATTSVPAWTDEYPQEFRALLPPLAGYVFHAADEVFQEGYFTITNRSRYDFQVQGGNQRGLLLASRNPLGRDSLIAYDKFGLLVVSATDPAGLIVTATHDYRVLQPSEVVDPNGNRSSVAFTPLGLLASTVTRGKTTEQVGDTPEVPGSRLFYDFAAFVERGEPISVRTIRRVHHVNDVEVTLPDPDETIETIEYSDGFGRVLQTRTQAADVSFGEPTFGNAVLQAEQTIPGGDAVGQQSADGEPSVVVTGWQVYDNKGQVTEKYEPFFSTGWAYTPPGDAQLGRKAIVFRDPRGQTVRTLSPDGSERRVIYGVPADLALPEQFAPTPWEAYTYDANDNAGRTHAEDPKARAYEHHWNTPASIVIDAMARTVEAVERNRARHEPGEPPTPIEDHRTGSSYDIRGNLLTVTDTLGRVAFRHVYDLANHPLRIDSIDAGTRRTVLDAIGSTVEARDSKGTLLLSAHDDLKRPVRVWARDDSDSIVVLRERTVYGDGADVGLTRVQAAAANLLGTLHRRHDEAGLLSVDANDFKGNPLEKVRQVIGDEAILRVFESSPIGQVQAFRVDWETADAAALLDANLYRTSLRYDALSRVAAMRYPEDVEGERKVIEPVYNRAGALERVMLDGELYVDHIAYNAKGQRTLIAYGNGVITRHAFDADTFRLVRMRSERYTRPADRHYHPTGAPLQDVAYDFDLAGNIVAIHDRTPESGVPNTLAGPDALHRAFTYDPLYRLLSATGREHATPPAALPWVDEPKSQDPTLTRAYSEHYDYDWAGNLLRMRHQAGAGGTFTRTFAVAASNNRLATITSGDTEFSYTYDLNGNLVSETASRHLEWDHRDLMRVYRTQAGDAEPSLHAQYLYDSDGQRVKKLVRRQGGQVDVTVYIDSFYEHHRAVNANAVQENNSLHVMDNASRIALLRVGVAFPGDATPAVKYHLGDHLGSSSVVVDEAGALVNREEYTPYGATSFGSFARKRYRFTGKERDEESGLSYHAARYYAPSLVRWVSCDPAGTVDGPNVYCYVRNNPMRLVDPTGTEGEGGHDAVSDTVGQHGGGAGADITDEIEVLESVDVHAVKEQAEQASLVEQAEQASLVPEPLQDNPDSRVGPKAPAFGQPFSDKTTVEILNHYIKQADKYNPEDWTDQMKWALGGIIVDRKVERDGGKDLNYAAADHYLNTRILTSDDGHFAVVYVPALMYGYDALKTVTLPLGINANILDDHPNMPSDPDSRVRDWGWRGIDDGLLDYWSGPGDLAPQARTIRLQ